MRWTTWSAARPTATSMPSWPWRPPPVLSWRGRRWGQTRAAIARRFASPSSTRRAGAPGRSRAQVATALGLPACSPIAARPCLSSRTPHAERRLRGKDDSLDAVSTARAALASETLALPRSGERREALGLLLVARRSAVDVRREAFSQLRGVIVTAPDGLREQLRALPVGKLLERCSRLRRSR